MSAFWISFSDFSWIQGIDILLVSIIIYYFYLAIRRTRILPVFQGIVVFIFLTVMTSYFKLETLSYILNRILELLFFAIVILFPSEIRRALYQIGQKIFFSEMNKVKQDTIDIIVSASNVLSKAKIGGIIIIEKNDRLRGLIRSGTILNANINKDLLISIFQKKSPLHDGAVLVGNNMIISAGNYIYHLSDDIKQIKEHGSRHRAGLGISEESDVVVVIVSEEKGNISLAHQAKIKHNLKDKQLKKEIYKIMAMGSKK